MEMGKEIRRLRQDRGLTQEALAAALNVTAQTVSKWECGNSIPDVQLLPEIAVYFGVSIDQLFAMTPAQQMERIENRIYARGLFDEAEERQLEQQLGAFAEDPALKGQAELLLTKLYNNQAEQYRLLAVEHGKVAVEETKGDSDAVSELTNAWGSYIPDWNVRNHHALIPSSAMPGAAISPTGTCGTTTPSSPGSATTARGTRGIGAPSCGSWTT